MARNKLKKFEELNRMAQVFQPSRDEILKNNFSIKGEWCKKFNNSNPIVLELGCGKGEYTINLAKMFPQKNYIGIDIKGSRIHTGATLANKESLVNVSFIRTQIEYLENIFSNNEISEIWITFPDPQIKYHRRKKRLTHPSFLSMYSNILKPGGLVHLKTDSMFLHGYTLGLSESSSLKVHKSIHDIYSVYSNDPKLNIKTYYEQKFLKNQCPISYLSFSFL
ncbi:MAG: tRNA (guanosine(46)-N7)-methyltransferase TrmB [Flavobacteriales bacterium]|nr:tRNA (guanosine(46)-N7)-methyltransferase TrmB [Flavobacteriales bacterium]|tara:strand:- start:3785 stop:4450 length:666 start_codon:yes stop_codon:yes gene_type:complete